MPAPTRLAVRAQHDPIARRIAAFINERFDGNILAASRAIGCTHNRLWLPATGRAKPSIALLQQLAKFSGRSVDWWVNGDPT